MKTVVLLSGGLDSSTLLYHLQAEGHSVTALAVDYGQRHLRELASAEYIAMDAQVPFITCNISRALNPIFAHAKSSQVGLMDTVPHGHYAAESMKTTIVPNRNMLLISIAGALASSLNADNVACAIHSGDHAIYPDCRPEFAESCELTLKLACGVRLIRPFIHKTKADIVKIAALLQIPIEYTYSCYEGNTTQCGKCGTCVERREAFEVAGITDLTVYKA